MVAVRFLRSNYVFTSQKLTYLLQSASCGPQKRRCPYCRMGRENIELRIMLV
jgi:hypothetical protein